MSNGAQGLMPGRNGPPLVLACHHKTGSCLLIQLVNKLAARLGQKRRLNRVIVGDPINRKLPLSVVMKQHPACDLYINQWFEHEVDVPADAVELAHFVRHPVKWVRSAYLYHKKGAPSEAIRWLDWRIFRWKGEQLSYCELLSRVDARLGLALEAVRCFPEILGTASVARSSWALRRRQQFTLEQVHEDFDGTISRLCGFMGLNEPGRPVGELKEFDLASPSAGPLPPNVTRTSSESAELEAVLSDDPQFSRLFSQAAQEMGFQLSGNHEGKASILPAPVVDELLSGQGHLRTSWQTAQQKNEFMRQPDSEKWWATYALQVPGCGHLMMQGFIQEMMDIVA
jgi:hypothetical protein